MRRGGTLRQSGMALRRLLAKGRGMESRHLARAQGPQLMFASALLCLATAIYFEARDQSLRGQLAVAQVVLQRVRDPRYPNDICSVVTDGGEVRHRCAFSFYCDGKSDQPTEQRAFLIAQWVAIGAMSGLLPEVTGGATHYHATRVQPYWASTMEPATRIGDHDFYRKK